MLQKQVKWGFTINKLLMCVSVNFDWSKWRMEFFSPPVKKNLSQTKKSENKMNVFL